MSIMFWIIASLLAICIVLLCGCYKMFRKIFAYAAEMQRFVDTMPATTGYGVNILTRQWVPGLCSMLATGKMPECFKLSPPLPTIGASINQMAKGRL